MYEGSEETTTVMRANELEKSDAPQIHISCFDGMMVSDASQFVFHKMADGTLFVELFPNKMIEQKCLHYFQTIISKEGMELLKNFLQNPTTY